MLYTNYTKEILGLQDAEVEKVFEIEKRIEITVRLKRKVHICPFCGRKTEKIHDYRTKRCNNKIKVLKQNAFGLKKFRMFRNRILTIFSWSENHIGISLRSIPMWFQLTLFYYFYPNYWQRTKEKTPVNTGVMKRIVPANWTPMVRIAGTIHTMKQFIFRNRILRIQIML